MNRVVKLNLLIFLFITLLTVVFNMVNFYSGSGSFFNIYVIMIVLFFNASLGFLTILLINKLVKISNRGYKVFIFYLILSCFLYIYVVSTILHFNYGTFLSLGGFYYFIATRTYYHALVFYFCSGLGILSLTFVFYFLSRKYVIEKNAPEKIMNKKIKILLIIAPIAIIAAILVLTPSKYAYDSSPLIELVAQNLIVDNPGTIPLDQISNNEGDKILDIDVGIDKPNFIIIMLESISAEHMPYYGYERDITPNIDSFAEKSIVFNKSGNLR